MFAILERWLFALLGDTREGCWYFHAHTEYMRPLVSLVQQQEMGKQPALIKGNTIYVPAPVKVTNSTIKSCWHWYITSTNLWFSIFILWLFIFSYPTRLLVYLSQRAKLAIALVSTCPCAKLSLLAGCGFLAYRHEWYQHFPKCQAPTVFFVLLFFLLIFEYFFYLGVGWHETQMEPWRLSGHHSHPSPFWQDLAPWCCTVW